MKKLSQRELIEDGRLRSTLGSLAAGGAKALAKKVSPSLYGDVGKVASTIKKAWERPIDIIKQQTKDLPEIYTDLKDVRESKGTPGIVDVNYTFTHTTTGDEISALTRFKQMGKQWTIIDTVVTNKVTPEVKQQVEDSLKTPEKEQSPEETDDKESSLKRKEQFALKRKSLSDARARNNAAMDALKKKSYDIPQPEEESPSLPDAEEPDAQPDAEESVPKLFDANDEEIQVGDYFIEPEELAMGIKDWGRVDSIDDRIITLTLIGSSHGDGEDAELTHKQWQEYKDTIEKSNGPEDSEMLVSEKSQKSLLKRLQSWSS